VAPVRSPTDRIRRHARHRYRRDAQFAVGRTARHTAMPPGVRLGWPSCGAMRLHCCAEGSAPDYGGARTTAKNSRPTVQYSGNVRAGWIQATVRGNRACHASGACRHRLGRNGAIFPYVSRRRDAIDAAVQHFWTRIAPQRVPGRSPDDSSGPTVERARRYARLRLGRSLPATANFACQHCFSRSQTDLRSVRSRSAERSRVAVALQIALLRMTRQTGFGRDRVPGRPRPQVPTSRSRWHETPFAADRSSSSRPAPTPPSI
jgi:hypothetical protein